jgi:hypothetical protein
LIWFVNAPPPEEDQAPSWLGRSLAVLAFLTFFLPVIGVLLGIPALVVNRKVAGWENVASRIGLGFSGLITLIVLAAWYAPVGFWSF